VRVPERIHFFSFATGVSLELPVGFTGGENADGAVYVHRDDEVPDAVVIVTVVGSAPPGAGADRDAAGVLVDAMATTAAEVLQRGQQDIDDERVFVAVLRFPHGLPAGGAATPGHPELAGLLEADVLVLFAAVGFDGRVVAITAAAPSELAGHYRTVFEQALSSCRFIAGVPA
jgi:hypothetical protein